jgi:sortase A
MKALDRAANARSAVHGRSDGRRRARYAGILIGALLMALSISYFGWIHYLRWFEQRTPSTAQVVQLPDGRQVSLNSAAPPSAMQQKLASAEVTRAEEAPAQPSLPLPTLTPSDVLPPERLRIPRIELDRPVVLSFNEQLPRFPGVGWLFGSAVPGAQGNMVLFGHLGGQNGVFQRLHELALGDELIVTTQQGDLHYLVERTFETTPDDVSVLLPGDGATATLITCSGPWDAVQQTNERRLIVVARLITPSPER